MAKQLTLGEIATVETMSGLAVSSIMEDSTPKGKALAAIAFVVKKRENPDYKFEDALELTMDEANDLVSVAFGLDEDPKVEN